MTDEANLNADKLTFSGDFNGVGENVIKNPVTIAFHGTAIQSDGSVININVIAEDYEVGLAINVQGVKVAK